MLSENHVATAVGSRKSQLLRRHDTAGSMESKSSEDSKTTGVI